jgi:hypothetical protein
MPPGATKGPGPEDRLTPHRTVGGGAVTARRENAVLEREVC